MPTLPHEPSATASSIKMECPKKRDPITIYNIREVKITEELIKKEHTCTICIDDFTVGESANQLNCGHTFHLYCFRPWNVRHWSCPNCRQQFRDENLVKSETTNINTELRTLYKMVDGQPVWYSRNEFFGPLYLRRALRAQ